MIFRSEMDTHLPPETGEALGRLLIEYQQLESTIRSTLRLAFQVVDPLEIIPDILTKGYTSNRKIETAQKILKLSAAKFHVADVAFTGSYPLMILVDHPEKANHQVENAFANLRATLSEAEELLRYRNELFHGDVKIEGEEVRFVGKEQNLIASEAGHFSAKRQQVMNAIMHLSFAAASFRTALSYLVRRAESEPQAAPASGG